MSLWWSHENTPHVITLGAVVKRVNKLVSKHSNILRLKRSASTLFNFYASIFNRVTAWALSRIQNHSSKTNSHLVFPISILLVYPTIYSLLVFQEENNIFWNEDNINTYFCQCLLSPQEIKLPLNFGCVYFPLLTSLPTEGLQLFLTITKLSFRMFVSLSQSKNDDL